MNKYKITLPKPRYMDEVPDCSFRYIFRDGTFSMHTYASGFHEKSPNVIGWIPAKVKVEEQIVPGWCEFEDLGVRQIFWRHSDGSISYSRKDDKICRDWKFIRQLTFEPDEEAEQPVAPEPKEGERWLGTIEVGEEEPAKVVRVFSNGKWRDFPTSTGSTSTFQPICKMEEVER